MFTRSANEKYLLNIKEKFLHHLFGMQYIEKFYKNYSTKNKNQKTFISLVNFLNDVVCKKILWTSLEKKIFTNFRSKSSEFKFNNSKELIRIIENKILGFYLLITFFKKFNMSRNIIFSQLIFLIKMKYF